MVVGQAFIGGVIARTMFIGRNAIIGVFMRMIGVVRVHRRSRGHLLMSREMRTPRRLGHDKRANY
ncbi:MULTISPECIES: hypothetical protein [Sphingomonadales]|jgi:hypothetical protein|uniref:hypothetical protein n=1 Tax=Sphingomonadales TaxID=204457 RepID=UPI000825B6B8|nr:MULTISPECIES: hypothetical protein [Sphingomonadales]OHC94715.1 MAG: hypothetical protein A2792_13275 [Sphingomonadales bacterium RIFCSPHIGHO2_01_FULL_65_20]